MPLLPIWPSYTWPITIPHCDVPSQGKSCMRVLLSSPIFVIAIEQILGFFLEFIECVPRSSASTPRCFRYGCNVKEAPFCYVLQLVLDKALLNFLNLSDAYLAHLPRPSAAADLVQELAFDAPSPPCTTFSRPPPTFFFVLGVEQGLAEFVEFVECVHRSSVSTSRSRYFTHGSRRVCDEPSLPCQVAPILLSCTATNITTIATGSGQHQPARGRDNDGHA